MMRKACGAGPLACAGPPGPACSGAARRPTRESAADEGVRPTSIAVVGVGNLLLSDDGIGIHAVEMLRAETRIASVAHLIDGGTIGPDLLAGIYGSERLLIIDAVDAGEPPGTIIRMDLNASAPPTAGMRNAHQSGIAELLDDLRLMGREPREAILLGVQPAALDFGTELSPEAARALPVVTEQAVREVERWTAATEEEQIGEGL